jgi:hypothetical protein
MDDKAYAYISQTLIDYHTYIILTPLAELK